MTKYPLDLRIIVVIWLISWFMLFYSLYYQFKKATISERSVALKLSVYSCLMVFLLFFLIYQHIDIMIITSSHYTTGLLWSLMVGLITYMFMNISGILKTKSSNQYEIIIVFVLIILSISGFGYFGIRFTIHERAYIYDFLYYHEFQTNSHKGIKFIGYNWLYMLGLFFISFLTEREI